MTNTHNTTLYIGVTSNIMKRVLQHKKGVFPESFTDQFLCHELVWFGFVPTIEDAIAQEKRIALASCLERAADREGECGMEGLA